MKLEHIIEWGESIYKEIKKARTNFSDCIICPMNLGDTIFMASLADEYKRQHEVASVMFVVKKTQADILNFFPCVDEILMISSDAMFALKIYIISMEYWNHDHIVYGHSRAVLLYHNSVPQIEYLVRGESMLKEQKNILGLSGEIIPSRMLPLDQGNNEVLKEMFEHSVLLMPAAQSLNRLPISFWENLSKRLKQEGFEVYTNYNGFDYEVMVRDTSPLESSIIELATIAPYFKCVISQRSGACDLLAQTETLLFILYDEFISKREVSLARDELGYYNIYDLVDRSTIRNYQYIKDLEDILIDTLINQMR